MFNKKIIISIIALVVILVAGYMYVKRAPGSNNDLEKVKKDYPELAGYVGDVVKWENKLNEDKTRVETYATLGLAWKSLAGKAYDLKINNYKDYYQKALDVYEKGVEVTGRKNTLFMVNAANMAKYVENYTLAEDYYKEAISVAPGDPEPYILLADLYENYLNKTRDEITAVYDEGLKRVLNPAVLESYKKSYLERAGK